MEEMQAKALIRIEEKLDKICEVAQDNRTCLARHSELHKNMEALLAKVSADTQSLSRQLHAATIEIERTKIRVLYIGTTLGAIGGAAVNFLIKMQT